MPYQRLLACRTIHQQRPRKPRFGNKGIRADGALRPSVYIKQTDLDARLCSTTAVRPKRAWTAGQLWLHAHQGVGGHLCLSRDSPQMLACRHGSNIPQAEAWECWPRLASGRKPDRAVTDALLTWKGLTMMVACRAQQRRCRCASRARRRT